MVLNASETTIKFDQACRLVSYGSWDYLDKVHNIIINDKENIDVKQLDEMKTLLKTLGPSFKFPSLEKLQEAMKNDAKVEIVKMLCEIGVDLQQKDSYGKTALHMACRGTRWTYGSTHKFHANPRIVAILLEHGASVHAKDCFGHTPLHDACVSGNLEIVQTLIQHNADVHATHKAWDTPLHAACWSGNLDVVQELLKYKPNVNALTKREEKMTPLMCAAQSGSIEIVEELLKHGADINFSVPEYGSAMHFAMPDERMINMLLKNGCNAKVRARLDYEDGELMNSTIFEVALDLKSIDIVKMIAFHET